MAVWVMAVSAMVSDMVLATEVMVSATEVMDSDTEVMDSVMAKAYMVWDMVKAMEDMEVMDFMDKKIN
jgi:hypothetical protein